MVQIRAVGSGSRASAGTGRDSQQQEGCIDTVRTVGAGTAAAEHEASRRAPAGLVQQLLQLLQPWHLRRYGQPLRAYKEQTIS